jgi:signal peptidase I
MTDHDHRPLAPSLLVAGLVLALMFVVVLGLGGCSQKPDTQFEPTKPLVGHFAVRGESMLPTLPTAHVAQIDVAYPFAQLAVGDIVLFWDYVRQGFTLHRIVAKQGAWFIVRGDNPVTNTEADAPFLTRANYIGRFVSSIP